MQACYTLGIANISAYPLDWKAARRQRAFELSQVGWAQFRIAKALGVSRPAVSQWLAAVGAEGPEALRARPHTGAPPKLTEAQLCLIPEFLSYGAEAYGFRGEVLTCARIAKIIEGEFGVSYSKSQVSRLMKAVEWTPQKPLKRATQRDEAQIEAWRTEVWPELKKRLAKSGASLSLLTNRASTCCRPWSGPTRPVARRPFSRCSRPKIICRS